MPCFDRLDIALFRSHSNSIYKIDSILELGYSSCSGEYGCNLSLLVQYGALSALEDYEEVKD